MTPLYAIGTDPQESGEEASPESTGLRLAPGRTTSRPRLGLIRGSAAATPRYDWSGRRRMRLALTDCTAEVIALTLLLRAFGKADGGIATALSLLVAMLVCAMGGAYETADVGLPKSTLDEVPLLLVLSGLTALTNTIVLPLLVHGELAGRQVAILWLALFGALAGARSLTRLASRTLGEAQRCIVIGDAEQAEQIRERFEASGIHASVIAAIPLTADILLEPETDLEASIRGVAHELHAQRIILAPSHDTLLELPKLIRVAKAVGIAVSMLPGTLDCVGHTVQFDDVNGMALVGIRSFGLSPVSRMLKRSLDVTVGAALTLMLAPVIFVIAVAIKLDSQGPVFFRQARVGRNGRHFQIIKFRSMIAGADDRKNELRALSEAGDGLFKITNDPRVTRVGAFLRSSSLDELPQILNVLRGEMSLVGPRPLVIDEDESIYGLDRSRLHLMPGMTGPWQILRKRVSRPEMIAIDYRYVAGWSLWVDLKILARTAMHVARRGNV